MNKINWWDAVGARREAKRDIIRHLRKLRKKMNAPLTIYYILDGSMDQLTTLAKRTYHEMCPELKSLDGFQIEQELEIEVACSTRADFLKAFTFFLYVNGSFKYKEKSLPEGHYSVYIEGIHLIILKPANG